MKILKDWNDLTPGGKWARKNRETINSVRKQWYAEHKEEIRQYGKNWRLKDPRKTLLQRAKRNAFQRGIPFSITLNDIYIPMVCPIFGIPLKSSRAIKPHPELNAPSLDRIVPALGYVPGNICVISHHANMVKSCGTAIEHRQIAAYIERLTR